MEVKGIDSARLRIFDGTMIKLTKVRHDAVIKKNLILIRKLKERGCDISTRGGVKKV